jgi:DNA-directed RNA polymerase subunit RPC12/RpoP
MDKPHQCIACGFETPFVANAQNHLERQGQYHDNTCPKCPTRVPTRLKLIEHVEIEHKGSWGYRCGICTEVLETEELRGTHRRYNNNKIERA